jgi:hypothetical protein
MIQKLGISNPSPDYVSRVATAFREGSINFDTHLLAIGDMVE